MSDNIRNIGIPMVVPMQKGRLGRGLASLIGEAPSAVPRLPAEGEQRILSIDQLHAGPFNPRKDFRDAELAELANSIRQKGLVQPIIARPDAATRRLRDRRRRAPLARGPAGRGAPGAGHRARSRRPGSRSRSPSSRTCSARPQRHRGGHRLQRAGRALRLHPGAALRRDRQEPQPSRQHHAPFEAAARGARADPGRQAHRRSRSRSGRARGCRRAGTPHRGPGSQRAQRRSPCAAARSGRCGRRRRSAAAPSANKDADTRAFEKDLAEVSA